MPSPSEMIMANYKMFVVCILEGRSVTMERNVSTLKKKSDLLGIQN